MDSSSSSISSNSLAVVVLVVLVVVTVIVVLVVEVAAGAEAVEEARDTSHPPPIGRPSYSCSHLPRCIIGITSHTSHVLHTYQYDTCVLHTNTHRHTLLVVYIIGHMSEH